MYSIATLYCQFGGPHETGVDHLNGNTDRALSSIRARTRTTIDVTLFLAETVYE